MHTRRKLTELVVCRHLWVQKVSPWKSTGCWSIHRDSKSTSSFVTSWGKNPITHSTSDGTRSWAQSPMDSTTINTMAKMERENYWQRQFSVRERREKLFPASMSHTCEPTSRYHCSEIDSTSDYRIQLFMRQTTLASTWENLWWVCTLS